MSNPAQDEADRFFSERSAPSAHPEDRDNVSDHSLQEEEKPRTRNIRGSRRRSTSDSENEDSDNAHNMTTTTATKTGYTVPSTTHYANTGPKGVIADAQNFHRAKKSSFRKRLSTFTSGFASFKPPTNVFASENKKEPSTSSDHSDHALSEGESESEFMTNWRTQRMQELTSNGPNNYQRRVSPSRRTWGSVQEVDANGYLDAIEKVSDDDIVVVMIYDPEDERSIAVEDELSLLAYRHYTTRFVKLHYDIAEMESIEVPAVLAYRRGDVFATISGAMAQEVEGSLRKHRVIE